jgi:hypothetical protein
MTNYLTDENYPEKLLRGKGNPICILFTFKLITNISKSCEKSPLASDHLIHGKA